MSYREEESVGSRNSELPLQITGTEHPLDPLYSVARKYYTAGVGKTTSPDLGAPVEEMCRECGGTVEENQGRLNSFLYDPLS